jgi:hypothetical protein
MKIAGKSKHGHPTKNFGDVLFATPPQQKYIISLEPTTSLSAIRIARSMGTLAGDTTLGPAVCVGQVHYS